MEDNSAQFYSAEELAKACEEAGFPVTTYSASKNIFIYVLMFSLNISIKNII